jgi:hypothetical protein
MPHLLGVRSCSHCSVLCPILWSLFSCFFCLFPLNREIFIPCFALSHIKIHCLINLSRQYPFQFSFSMAKSQFQLSQTRYKMSDEFCPWIIVR